MQYHLNGFKPGNLQISESVRERPADPKLVDLKTEVDVLIVGCGPAGLALARQLSEFEHISTCIVDLKSGPMMFGQADGVSCRTIEIMEAYNSSETVVKESYWLNQTSFWQPDSDRPEQLVRTEKVADPRIGLSEFPHVILNQSRIHDLLLEGMKHAPAQVEPNYCRRLLELNIDQSTLQNVDAHPITAIFERVDIAHKGKVETVRAKYIVGCDGARSTVRKQAGIKLRGDAANKAWGVMDALVVTDFPDIRIKSFIQSADDGTIMIIPREGGYLVRLYIELGLLGENQRATDLGVTIEDLKATAQRIFHPFQMDIKEVPWWSVYEIGQRVSDKFDNSPEGADVDHMPRLFIAGDACHTHSPKAGQGMNVSIHDSFNLGWKLASVLSRHCHPKLLHTYSGERRNVAQELIELDRTFAKLVAAKASVQQSAEQDGTSAQEIQNYLAVKNSFIAGTSIQYKPSIICAAPTYQHLAKGFAIGQRFHSTKAVRISDGRPLHLGHLNKADGRWRIFLFDGSENANAPSSDFSNLVQFLTQSEHSPITKYTPSGQDIDSVIDVYGVFQQSKNLCIEQMPDLIWPTKGIYGLRDFEKAFTARQDHDIYQQRGIDRALGCMVVVRPDQHVANVLPLTAHTEISDFFEQFMLS